MRLGDVGASVATRLNGISGSSCTYVHGNSELTVTGFKSNQRSQLADQNGAVTEVLSTDFLFVTADLTFGDPTRGDFIFIGNDKYGVQPVSGEKCFRRLSDGMTRVHTKKVAK